MITDDETDFLYLADTVPSRFPDLYYNLTKALNERNIPFGLLPGTKDIWARDYMPVQVGKDNFVQFVYMPDYLQSKVWKKTISNSDAICTEIGINTKKVDLIVDGGNIVKGENKVIMCDKVFKENPNIPLKQLIAQLKDALEVEKIIFIPTDPSDRIGHADGCLRFSSDDCVLVNRYVKEKEWFKNGVITSLNNAGLDWIETPYNPYDNKTYMDASGSYVNYLQLKDFIFLPQFGITEDESALKLFKRTFTDSEIIPIDCRDLAKEGGILNCISWNIKK